MTQDEYNYSNSLNGLNESWVTYKQEQQDEILIAAQEYEQENKQPETNLI
jgi:hypothetical protein